MANKNEVDLVVKAKNEASKTLKAIRQAFEDFKTSLDDTNSATAKGNVALGGLAAALSELNKKAAGLKALDEVSQTMAAATAASKRLESTVSASSEQLARSAIEAGLAAERTKRLAAEFESEKATLKSLTSERKSASKSLTETKNELLAAEAAQRRFNEAQAQQPRTRRGVGIEVGAPQSSARASAAAMLAAEVEAASKAFGDAKQFIDLYDAEINDTKKTLTALEPAVKAAADQQRKLEAETAKQTATFKQNEAALADSVKELESLRQVSREVEALAGQQVVSQAKVANAYANTAAEIERVTRLATVMNRYSTGSGGFTDPKTASALQKQNAAISDAEQNWKLLEAEARRLGVALQSVSGNATAQVNAFKNVVSAARAARAEYTAQVAALGKMQGSVKSSFAAWSQAAGGFKTFTGSAQAVAPAAAQASGALKSAAQSSTSLTQSLTSNNNASRQSLSLLQRLRGEVLALAASYVGIQGGAQQLMGVVQATNTLEAAQSRLNVAFKGNGGQVGKELVFIQAQSQRLGISFEVLSEQYSKFAVAAQGANFTGQATRDIFLSIAEAGKVQRLSIDQLQGVFKALEQIISKGKVQSEELRGQLGDRMTGAFKLFADAIGVTTSELDSMLKKGEVIANQDTLGKVGERLRQVYGPELANAIKSTNTELGRFTNNIFQSQLRVGEGGFMDAFANGLRQLNENFQSREGRDFFLALGSALGKVTNGLTAALPYFDDMAVVIGVLVALKAGSWFQGLTTSLASTATQSLTTNRALFTVAGNAAMLQARWNALVGTLRVGVGVINGTRAQFSALGSQVQQTGARMVALRVGISSLQTVAAVATGVFRTMWAALGGIPGIVLTGLSVILGNWLFSVKETTSAVDEHKRIMEEVVKAYDAADKSSASWAKNIRSATLDQAVASLRKLRDELDATKKASEGIYGQSFFSPQSLKFAGKSGELDLARQMREVNDAFKEGKISAADLVTQIAKLYAQVQDDGVRRYGEALLEAGRKSAEMEKRVAEAEIIAKTLGDTTVKTEGTVEDLAGALKDAGDSAAATAKRTDQFNTALKSMGDLVPKLSSELEKLGEIDALNKLYQDAANAAGSFGELYKATQLYNQGLDRIVSGSLGANSSFVDIVAGVESGGDPNAKNSNSSATGLGQFITSTWIRMFKQYFPEVVNGFAASGIQGDALNERILQYRKDPAVSKQMIALYAQENARYLAAQGISASNATLYLAHFLGAGDAAKVINAPASTPVADVVNSNSVAANPTVLGGGKTAGEVVAWAERKTKITKEELAAQQQISELDTKAAAATTKRIADKEAEVQKQKLIADGKAREAAIEDAVSEAKRENVNITDEQLAQVRELAGQEFDLKNIKTEQKNEQAQANEQLRQAQALYQQQLALEAQLKQQRGLGDATGADATQLKLTEVNGQLQAAISNARQMWEAIGGEAATTAIAKLDTLNTKIATANTRTNSFGLTSQQVSGFVDSFATGIANAFGSFAQAVASGENAFKAFGQAVLQTLAQVIQQIAVAILRTMILKALTGMGGGIGSAASGLLGATVNHSGNVTGSTTRSRSISASALAAPFVYHTGGVAGLRSNEVVSVLEQGETIRTAEQEAALTEKQAAAERASSQGNGGFSTLRNIITLDEDSAKQFLTSATGEKAIWDVLGRNKGKLRGLME
jgi:tape measure domain-containing protein